MTGLLKNASGPGRAASAAWVKGKRDAILLAILVNGPLLALMLAYRITGVNRYFSYSLPGLGDFPKGALFDAVFIGALLVGWALVAPYVWARRIFVCLFVLAAAFVTLFRLTDYYYHLSTGVPLNIYVMYENAARIEEGAGVLLRAPWFLVAGLTVAVHYLTWVASGRYRRSLGRLAAAWARSPWPLVVVPLTVVLLLVGVNAHALSVQAHRRNALLAFAGEYEFLRDLSVFIKQQSEVQQQLAVRPTQLLLPTETGRTGQETSEKASERRRPDIFLITVESFNALYAAPAETLNVALHEPVMPFFQSLTADGVMFGRVYTSSAYTFNGIVATLCSQYTMNEMAWGSDCLPDLLARNGYEPYSLISVRQLRPYRYDNFGRIGFPRAHVYDAVRMREGKQNVFFDFMLDREVFDFASALADSALRVPDRKPLFIHISTNQMHVPGYSNPALCKPYLFPPALEVAPLTRDLINAAHCTDQDLANFISQLKSRGLYDDALVIVTADHAFNISFWDHRETELARIPLLMKFPKGKPGTESLNADQLAGQIDIVPTVVDYLGLTTTRPMYGRSLLRNIPDEHRILPGISISRLISLATRDGLSLHVQGKADLEDASSRALMEQVFGTVAYFDQHPDAFFAAVDSALHPVPVAVGPTRPPIP